MSEPVELYLYDLSNGMAASMSVAMLGKYFEAIWHSSIVVFGEEIFFGQGIQRTRPGGSHHGQPLKRVKLGTTQIDRETFHEYLASLQEVYTADKYHLLTNNCNNFTQDVYSFLVGGTSYPQEVIDLPKEFLSTPFGRSLQPMINDMFQRGHNSTSAGAPVQPPPQLSQQFASNPALSGALQQVAQAATRSQKQPQMPLATPADPVSSQLTVATNMASFRSVLSSNRCVAVMFTGDWCGPCKTIKPVFQDLARRSSSDPPVEFVLVDTTAGREIAQCYSISAVPTFKFFLRGEQLHEIKGADAGELRTQVGILAMSGYPAHAHTRLQLPKLRALSTAPILFEQKPNFEAALAKLESFSAGSTSALKLASSTAPSALSPAQTTQILSTAHSLLSSSLAPAQVFPLLDILKYLILDPKVATLAAETPIAPEGQSLLPFLLARLARPGQGQSESEQEQTELPKSTLITLLRLLCNALSALILADSLLKNATVRADVTQIVVKALLASDSGVRTCAGSLTFSVAGWQRKQRKDWVDVDENTDGEHEDFEVELCTAVLEALDRETDAAVAHRLVASLGSLLYLSPHFDNALSPLVEALEAKRILQSKKDVLKGNADALALTAEVVRLAESTA